MYKYQLSRDVLNYSIRTRVHCGMAQTVVGLHVFLLFPYSSMHIIQRCFELQHKSCFVVVQFYTYMKSAFKSFFH